MDFLSRLSVLNPKGAVALAERGLMLHAVEFMLIVAVAVYFLLFFFAWRYRAGNKKAAYRPNDEHGALEELVWWVIPFEIVLVLGALTWGSTHELDPRRALSDEKPMIVQVVALDWKWLFIYPKEGIASVNYLAMPARTPVKFEVTADAPMNSFWIPQLGGQIYAMTGMVTALNLEADGPGVYQGYSANYSGDGFSSMHFKAESMEREDFEAWVARTKSAQSTLNFGAYTMLAKPGVLAQAPQFGSVEPGLFDTIVMQFSDAGAHMPAHSH